MHRAICFPIAFLFFILSASAQSGDLPNTMLWRISKEGFMPSYLFGTAQLKDRRVFRFSDSLYHFLQKADGFAAELDPDEAMTELFKTFGAPDTSGLLKDAMKEDDFKKIAGELEAKYGVPAERITKKQAWLYRHSWESTARKADDMDVLVDLYLYNIAKNSGKQVSGTGDLDDQLNMMDESGSAFDTDELLGRNTNAAEVERLIRIYIAQDLNALGRFIHALPADDCNKILLKYNPKMVRRIDSLAQVRSYFFAVGAARLPGAAGLLQLLKDRGFAVEPIFSKKIIAPQNYSYTKKEWPWQTVENGEKTFAVSMPGKPSLLTLNEAVKMQVYADLGSGLIYFVTGYSILPGLNKDSALLMIIKNMGMKSVSKPQTILHNGIKGLQSVRDSGGYFYRIQLWPNGDQVVMTMIGCQNKSRLYSTEAQRFYNSLQLTPPHVKPAKDLKDWYVHRDERLAVQVAFPGAPAVNKTIQQNFAQQAGADGWHFYNRTYLDEPANAYYLFIAKEAKPDHYILDDAALFDEAKNNLEAQNQFTVTRYDTGRWQGLPAMWMDGVHKQSNLQLKSRTINRGNRGYTLMAIYDGKGDTTAATAFLESLQLFPLNESGWQTHTDETALFTTTAPGAFQLQKKDSLATGTTKHTSASYDSLSAFSYQVVVEPLPAYFWATDDSAFFESVVAGYTNAGDSILYSKNITNGAAAGKEYVIRMHGGRNNKRLRFLLNGDSLYLLYFVAPEPYHTPASNQFFSHFRFLNFRPAQSLFQNKTTGLLNALQSGDSAAFAEAKDFINQAPFSKADLPRLHQALLRPYRDMEEDFYGVHYGLLQRAIALSDTATIDFIKASFSSLNGENSLLQYPLLQALAEIKKDISYAALKALLLQQLPRTGNSNGLAYALRDSLALTQKLAPEVLALSSDSLFCNVLTRIVPSLIENNLLQPSEVIPYTKNFIAQAVQKEREINRSAGENAWALYDDIQVLGKLNNAESTDLLQRFSRTKWLQVQEPAVRVLLTNKQPVAAASIAKVAADKYYRLSLYGHLKKLNRLPLFPATFATQKNLAESALYQYLTDDDSEPSHFSFVGERQASYMGGRKSFYLFKVEYGNAYLGIAGPFETGSKTIVTAPEILGISDEPFNAKETDAQLKAYLKAYKEAASEE